MFIARVFAPLVSTSTSSETFAHYKPYILEFPFLDSMMDLQLDTNVELSLDFLRSTFLHMSQLSIGGLLAMVCEHF